MESLNFENIPAMWHPAKDSGTQMKNLMKKIEDKYSVKFDGYWDFHQWSVDHIPEFWSEIWDYAGIICSKKYHQVIDLSVPMEQSPEWFKGAELNYAENLMKYRDDSIALIIAGEETEPKKVTFAQMYEEVTLYAAAFRKLGIKKGDVVACYMSNRCEAVYAMLAAVSIGALWTGALPNLGSKAVLNRLSQVCPKILITIDRFPYEGKEIEMLVNIKEISTGLQTLEKVIIVPSKESSKLKDITEIRNSCFLDDFLKLGLEEDGSVQTLKFEQVPLSHPIFINFTSGTTGLPKPLISGSGILLSAPKSYGVHCDSPRGSVWLTNSPVGWGTWNMYMTMLAQGITLLLFEGSPYYLSPTFLWDLIDECKVSYLFSPSSLPDELEKRGYLPTERHKLTSLRAFMAGGSVVKPSSYDFMYKIAEGRFPFSSSFGTTEFLDSPFILEQTLPVHRGEMNCITLGYNIECLDEEGRPVVGEIGELVLTKPIPNLMLGVLGDPDGSKYRSIYYSKYPGKFQLSDNGIINPITKGIVICGRSDDTLKQRGCRFGSSEIYDIVETFPEVRDSLCVSHYNKNMDERAVLFLRMREGRHLDDELVGRVREAIAREMTPNHVPDVIIEAGDIPYNMNGKKMEILVKKIINHKPCNIESVINQDSLKYYRNREELQDF